jgi:hypothetical protein
MASISFEQALFHRPDRRDPQLLAKSPGFDSAMQNEAEALIFGFGDRPGETPCPLTVFAKPLTKKLIAIVRVIDQPRDSFPTALRFHFLVVSRNDYDGWIRDPFLLSAKFEPTWDAAEALPTLSLGSDSFSPRSVAQVQSVLKRVKASALREGEDPEAPDFERTAENSESPALLGAAQILVDGGRVIFERAKGDLTLASGLWLLLPEGTRSRLWPCSFAFSQDLEFDLLIVPYLDDVMLESYTTEQQAADYPEGTYELALQKAAEAGDQRELDIVFARRDSYQTIRLAITILLIVSGIVLFSKWLDSQTPPNPPAKVEKANDKK